MNKISPTTYFREHLYINPKIEKGKRRKVKIDEFYVPVFKEYGLILSKNYNVSQLKSMARYYKLKVSGNKMELIKRVWNYLRFSNYATVIQKIWRGTIVRKFFGIAMHKKCVNSTDFLSLNDLSKIPKKQLFTFKDQDGFIYGFDAKSFHNLILKNKEPTNPYNRKLISKKTITRFNHFIKYGKIIGNDINLVINNNIESLSLKKQIELKAHDIFQRIDQFGHITDTSWFLDLSRLYLKRLVRELIDIWNYRASLTPEVKRSIYPPTGDPFNIINSNTFHSLEKEKLQLLILKIFKNIITKSNDINFRALGAFYILGAITLVNSNAAIALPWLYESVYYSPA